MYQGSKVLEHKGLICSILYLLRKGLHVFKPHICLSASVLWHLQIAQQQWDRDVRSWCIWWNTRAEILVSSWFSGTLTLAPQFFLNLRISYWPQPFTDDDFPPFQTLSIKYIFNIHLLYVWLRNDQKISIQLSMLHVFKQHVVCFTWGTWWLLFKVSRGSEKKILHT